MQRLSLVLDFSLLVLFFTITVCVVDDKLEFLQFFTLDLIFYDTVIFEYIVGIKPQRELFSEFGLSGLEP